jgi:hypothetical protein
MLGDIDWQLLTCGFLMIARLDYSSPLFREMNLTVGGSLASRRFQTGAFEPRIRISGGDHRDPLRQPSSSLCKRLTIAEGSESL